MSEKEIEQQILALEERIWQANREGDAAYFEANLSDDALAVAAFGIFDKADAVAQVRENRIPFTRTEMFDPRVIVVSPESALITYRAEIDAVREGQPFSFSIYATTVWRKEPRGWRAVLHQQTPLQAA